MKTLKVQNETIYLKGYEDPLSDKPKLIRQIIITGRWVLSFKQAIFVNNHKSKF